MTTTQSVSVIKYFSSSKTKGQNKIECLSIALLKAKHSSLFGSEEERSFITLGPGLQSEPPCQNSCKILPFSLSLSLSVSLCLTHTHIPFLSFSLSHTHSLSLPLSHTHILSLPLSLYLSHSLSFSLSMPLSIRFFWCRNTQLNDIQPNYTQHNDIQHNGRVLSVIMLDVTYKPFAMSVFRLIVVMLSVVRLIVVILSVVMPIVVRLNVVAPFFCLSVTTSLHLPLHH
jgi:hypothetical protein